VTEFLQLLILGMATGGFYTLNAIGIVVVFRSSGIINFAGGGVAMVGGYTEWQLADAWGTPQWLAVVAAVVAAALVNSAIYVIAVRPLARAATLTKVIATLAILVSIQQAVLLIFGGLPKVPTSFLPRGSAHIGSVQVGTDSLTILVVAVGLTCALWAVYRWTRFGVATSALSEAPRSLAALGWNIGRLRAANWAIGGGLAGLAGAGLGPLLQLTPNTFANLLVPTLAGALIGGLRSFPLALVGGLVVGASQALAGSYITLTGVSDAVPFLLIILVMLFRGRSLPGRDYLHERLPRVGSGEVSIGRLVCVLAVAAVLASVVKVDWVIGATVTMMFAVVLLSQVVITGYAGQMSLAQLTLAGVGAMAAANVAASWGAPFLLCLVVGMVSVVPVSVLVGLPSLRARGVSLAVATLGFAVAIFSAVLSNTDLSGGLTSLVVAPPSIFGWSINPTLYPRRYFIVALAVFSVLALSVANLRRSPSGRRMLAVRSNERAAVAVGINVTGIKLYAFTVAGSIAAAGGVLIVFGQAVPVFSGFDPIAGLSNLVGAVLGGVGFVPGAVIGGLFNNDGLPNALLYPYVGQLTWWTELFPLLAGVALVVQLIINPDGIAAALARRAEGGRVKTKTQARAKFDDRVTAKLGFLAASPATRRRAQVMQQLDEVGAPPRLSGNCSLRARDLRVVFGSVVALAGVDICVEAGQVLAVIGPNGAGKTTLMDALTGFVPSTGSIELAGEPIDGLAAHQRARRGLARSFQSLELFEDMTVLDNVRCAADHQNARSLLLDLVRMDRGALTPATVAAIRGLDLRDSVHRLPGEIGYGRRRLVAIARALAGQPRVLLLDEPAAGLSEFERTEVAQLIRQTARDWNIAIIVIEHDVELVRQVADHVVALNFGSTIATGTPDEVLSHPEVIRAYLGADEPAPRPGEPAQVEPGPRAGPVESEPRRHDQLPAAGGR
jgi:ABC-type branched-subunit amino acid transport system ATPase component/branched-subunit amino acid ABC-type transport system permease component